MTYAETLKHHRKRNDLTQRRLAHLLGTSVVQITRMETQGQAPMLWTYLRLCDVLGPRFHTDCMQLLDEQ